MMPDERCRVPPVGWTCTRTPGHEGPCATVPVDETEKSRIVRWLRHTLRMNGPAQALADAIDQDSHWKPIDMHFKHCHDPSCKGC